MSSNIHPAQRDRTIKRLSEDAHQAVQAVMRYAPGGTLEAAMAKAPEPIRQRAIAAGTSLDVEIRAREAARQQDEAVPQVHGPSAGGAIPTARVGIPNAASDQQNLERAYLTERELLASSIQKEHRDMSMDKAREEADTRIRSLGVERAIPRYARIEQRLRAKYAS